MEAQEPQELGRLPAEVRELHLAPKGARPLLQADEQLDAVLAYPFQAGEVEDHVGLALRHRVERGTNVDDARVALLEIPLELQHDRSFRRGGRAGGGL